MILSNDLKKLNAGLHLEVIISLKVIILFFPSIYLVFIIDYFLLLCELLFCKMTSNN